MSSVEVIDLPDYLSCSAIIGSSRLRQGLHLDALLYFSDRKTCIFFRVTNVSSDVIALDTKRGIAQLIFERLDQPTDAPYNGSLNDEYGFTGMGSYKSLYEHGLKRIEKKAGEVKGH